MSLVNGLPFYSQSYWEDFYRDKTNISNSYDWYFNLTSIKCNLINLSNLKKDSEILIIGVGNSSKLFMHLMNIFIISIIYINV